MRELAISVLIGLCAINAVLLLILLHTLISHRDVFFTYVFPTDKPQVGLLKSRNQQDNLRLLLYYGARVCLVLSFGMAMGLGYYILQLGVEKLVA